MRVRLLRMLRRQSPRRRLVIGAAASLAIHLLVLGALVALKGPTPKWVPKRGDALFVELPNPEEEALKGRPAPPAPPAPAKPTPAPPTPKASAPKAPTPTVEPKPAAPPKTATASPPPSSRPEPPAPRSEPKAPSADSSVAASSPPTPAPSAPRAPAAVEPPRTAEVPPAREAPGSEDGAPDLRSALRRGGGADGRGDGRGGIEGEPIPLDSVDPKYADYLERIRRMIKANWAYPCVKNAETRECEYKSAQLVIEFGIAKDGRVPFLTVRQSSGYVIMDDYAVNAVKLASPFPPVPDSLSRKGIPILARFHYVVESSLVNLLR